MAVFAVVLSTSWFLVSEFEFVLALVEEEKCFLEPPNPRKLPPPPLVVPELELVVELVPIVVLSPSLVVVMPSVLSWVECPKAWLPVIVALAFWLACFVYSLWVRKVVAVKVRSQETVGTAVTNWGSSKRLSADRMGGSV